MANFKEYKSSNYAKVGEDILAFWKENNIFEQSISSREGKPTFTFFEGPPSANGTPGIHHVMARTVKDVFCRYKTLKGFQVKRKGGWDTHGLPVELKVEKDLGITKEDIGKKISVEEYNKACRESVMKFKGEWDDLTEKMGYWVDLNDPYITFDKKYIETVWYLLKELYKKDFLYKGYTIQPYSPAAGTGLSTHELNQPGCYKNVKDTSVVAQFKIKGTEKSYFLAWTTTPWTLPANSALAVGKNITYVKVETFNPYTGESMNAILAKDLIGKFFKAEGENASFEDYKLGDKIIPWKAVQEKKGSELVGIEYEQLLPYIQPEKPAFKVIEGDYVSTEDGTGIVHIAPTFGADDKRVADLAGIPAIAVYDEEGNELPIVDKQGRFVPEITDFAGRYVKEAYEADGVVTKEYKSTDVLIAIKLKEENKAFKVEKYEHSYPHCWRTDKPVLYYPLSSWFVRTTAIKDKLVALNNEINWKPASTGTGRFGNWLENLVDWNLSRSRFWGTPLPIWRTKEGKEEKCIGSIAELEQEIVKAKAAGISNPDTVDDLHRPYVDDITLVSDSGEPMYRETDLIDVWFDSGAMPYAQWHYPFENNDIFEKNFPADFIAEGVDQTRGWFFTLHAIGTMLFDSVAFKNVIANGLVLDKSGEKMSKRKGNVVDPFEAINKYGPDANRWYMIVNAPPWDNLKFDLDGVTEVQRRFFGTFYNTYNFFAIYANIDGFTGNETRIPVSEKPESDRWVLSKLHSLIAKVDKAFNEYEPTRAARAIQDFVVDDLSNWYVRLNRKRFWTPSSDTSAGIPVDKLSAYQTLYECLQTVARLASPIAPFYFEQVFKDLNEVSGQFDAASVHLADFPVSDASIVDEALETKMDLAQRVSSLVHSIRKQVKIKVRQPLEKILVPVSNEETKANIEAVKPLILTEVNIKNIEYPDASDQILVKNIKPNFKKLGKQFGPKMKAVAQAIQGLSQEAILQLEQTNAISLDVEGEAVSLTLEDVEISFKDVPGWMVASDGLVTVALDINLTDDLKKEGLAREVVNRIQNLRKDMGMDVQDKIKVVLEEKEGDFTTAMNDYSDYISKEVQALSFSTSGSVNANQEIEIEGMEIKVEIEVLQTV